MGRTRRSAGLTAACVPRKTVFAVLSPSTLHGAALMARRVLVGLAVAGLLGTCGVAQADRPQWARRVLPFAQTLDMDAVYQVAHSAPRDLISTIARFGIDIRLVRSEAPTRPVNPLLAALPVADHDLLRQAEFKDSYEGRMACVPARCGEPERTVILIRDTASNYTLIHEFAHTQLRIQRQHGVSDEVIEARFSAAFRRLSIYQRRLYDDPYRLLDPLWRRDILAAQSDVALDLFDRIRLGQSQEAIVEKVLSSYIDERSPYQDPVRRAEGLRYGINMIDNAIDVFNVLHDSTVFVEDTVQHLRQAIREGGIDPDEGVRLSDDDVAVVRLSAKQVLQKLAAVRTEIQVLKDFLLR